MTDLAASPDDCPACLGESVLRWTQPSPAGTDSWILREMQTPCPHGCGETWTHPAAESGRVIDPPDDRPERVVGQVDAMHATARDSGYGEFMRKALANAGYSWDHHGHRQS